MSTVRRPGRPVGRQFAGLNHRQGEPLDANRPRSSGGGGGGQSALDGHQDQPLPVSPPLQLCGGNYWNLVDAVARHAARVTHAAGVPAVLSEDTSKIAEAVAVAQAADQVVLALGTDLTWAEEGRDAVSIAFTKAQVCHGGYNAVPRDPAPSHVQVSAEDFEGVWRAGGGGISARAGVY